MPSTHLSLHYHLIFSTKDRVPYMQKEWRGRLHAYLGGIVNDLGGVPEFNRGVYDIARKIPPGQTLTYGDIAKQLGGVELSRDVGQALGRNPCPIVVPCHRVLAAGNKPGGFSANGGVVTKLKMLAIEGAVVNHTPSLFD